jgi:pimeloyl-ACP methyl ester carboxylesterase
VAQTLDTKPALAGAMAGADGAAPFRRVSYAIRGGDVAGIAFGDPTRAPDIVFLHAAGLNARAYRTLLAPLGERFHVVALDLRGHGRTRLPARVFGYSSWGRHRDDIIAVLERHFKRPVTLAGHSLGATASLLAAGKRPDLVAGLALIDPVILSPGAHTLWRVLGAPSLARAALPMARVAARRRRDYPDQATAVAALKRRGWFTSFPAEALLDYVEDGFTPAPDGGLRLACAREYEAATYAAQRHDPWTALERAPPAIVMLRAGVRSTISPAVAKRFSDLRPDARVATVDAASHALPWERPDRVRAAIEMAALMAQPKGRFADLDDA